MRSNLPIIQYSILYLLLSLRLSGCFVVRRGVKVLLTLRAKDSINDPVGRALSYRGEESSRTWTSIVRETRTAHDAIYMRHLKRTYLFPSRRRPWNLDQLLVSRKSSMKYSLWCMVDSEVDRFTGACSAMLEDIDSEDELGQCRRTACDSVNQAFCTDCITETEFSEFAYRSTRHLTSGVDL